MAGRTKAEVCSRLIAGIMGSDLAEGMDVRLVYLFCVSYVAASVTG